jgi:SIR2-like domain/Caspase domain
MAERRHALIVATSEYRDPEFAELVAPGQDADALIQVLQNPKIGGYTVTDVRNAESSVIWEEIESFCSERERDDLSLLYFSCHGVKGKDGRLYLASTNTRPDRLRSTSVPAGFINDVMGASHSKRQVLILDCCYSGAFSRGMQVKSGGHLSVMDDFEGEGRVVLTASTAMQYAFVEDKETSGKGARSLLTSGLVAGLETGEADSDGDGKVSFDELYTFVRKRVREHTKDQDPERSYFGLKGDLILARSVAARRSTAEAKRTAVPPPAVPRVGQDALDDHCDFVARKFHDGSVVPFLGESVNLYGRSANTQWNARREFAPTEAELAEYLAAVFDCPASDAGDLMSVAEYVTAVHGPAPLYEETKQALVTDYEANPLHRLLSGVPSIVRRTGRSAPLVILTTNYDTALEQAFEEQGEPFDLLAYAHGTVTHYPPNRDPVLIERPNTYAALKPEERPVIVKLRGGVDRENAAGDAYVMTQEDYLGRSGSGVAEALPVVLRAHCFKSVYLLLGQSARHRGVRILLGQLWSSPQLLAWAIQTDPDEVEERFWRQKEVRLLNADLDQYAATLSQHLG